MTGTLTTNNRPLKIIIVLRPKKSASSTGEQGGNHPAQQNSGDDEGELARIQPGGGFQIRQRAGDDAHIHAEQQSAETGDKQQEAIVAGFGIFVFHVIQGFARRPQFEPDGIGADGINHPPELGVGRVPIQFLNPKIR